MEKYNGNCRRWGERMKATVTVQVTVISSSILQLKCKKIYASTMKQHKLYNHAWNVFETNIWCEQCNNKHVYYNHVSALMWTQLYWYQICVFMAAMCFIMGTFFIAYSLKWMWVYEDFNFAVFINTLIGVFYSGMALNVTMYRPVCQSIYSDTLWCPGPSF